MEPKTTTTSKSGLSRLNIPNLLCLFRIFGSAGLIALAWNEWRYVFVGWYAILAFTDLIDGPLARWLGQKSRFGALLDTIADTWLSCCLLAGALLLSFEALQGEWILILLGISSYVPVVLLALVKFRRWPALHTYLAKTTHVLVVLAGICLVLEWSVWPLRAALFFLLLTNIEGLLIIGSMKDWRTDVASLIVLKCENKPNDSE